MSLLVPAAARADELTPKAYPATLEPGLTESEVRYGRIIGDDADGEDGLLLEMAHHFSNRVYGGLEVVTSRQPGGERHVEALGAEAILTLGSVAGVNVAVLGEYAANRHSPDAVATKLLLQKCGDEFHLRLNLAAEKTLERGESIEFGYAASIDHDVAEDLRLGVMGVGKLGTSKHFSANGEHFAGPIVRYEIDHLPGRGDLELEAGYLFAVGDAPHEANGLVRFMLEYGVRF